MTALSLLPSDTWHCILGYRLSELDLAIGPQQPPQYNLNSQLFTSSVTLTDKNIADLVRIFLS